MIADENTPSCPIPAQADLSGITTIKLSPKPSLDNYLQGMKLANREAEERIGDHMLLSWYDARPRLRVPAARQ
jgi:hypothetical protein